MTNQTQSKSSPGRPPGSRNAGPRKPPERLVEVLALGAEGLNYREIGDRLGISRQRVERIYVYLTEHPAERAEQQQRRHVERIPVPAKPRTTKEQYRDLRLSLGMNQTELAAALDVNLQTISRRERGDSKITREAELAILQLVGAAAI